MISCVEIENPYRYRSYQVGERVFYNIKNDTVKTPDDGVITKITQGTSVGGLPVITIEFDSGNRVEVTSATGLIIIHREWSTND